MTLTHNIAAIDVGTNSVHMVIAKFMPDGSFITLAKERMQVRLGSGGADMTELQPEAADRAIAALLECSYIANAHNAEIIAVATSAVREAHNASDFLQRVKHEAGVIVDVLSGTEEARLIHMGALHSTHIAHKAHLVIDIGGGSTEFIAAEGTTVAFARSLKLGHMRLTNRFFPDAVITPNSIENCRNYIQSFLAPMAKRIQSIGFDVAVGCSGTVASAASICAAHRHITSADHRIPNRHQTPTDCQTSVGHRISTDRRISTDYRISTDSSSEHKATRQRVKPQNVANTYFDKDELEHAMSTVTSCHHPNERASISGLSSSRADVIVAGMLLLQQIFDTLDIQHMLVSSGALREGVLINRFHHNFHYIQNGSAAQQMGAARQISAAQQVSATQQIGIAQQVADVRKSSAISLAYAYSDDIEHIEHVAALALQMFEVTSEAHQLDASERLTLEVAALLHNIGHSIAHSGHHKHSEYMIRHSERLLGFTEHELQVIASVARYHRRAFPSKAHAGWMKLNRKDQHKVRVLAGLLRLSIALDRTHRQAVRIMSASVDDATVELHVTHNIHKAGKAGIEIELYTAKANTGLITKAIDRDITFIVL